MQAAYAMHAHMRNCLYTRPCTMGSVKGNYGGSDRRGWPVDIVGLRPPRGAVREEQGSGEFNPGCFSMSALSTERKFQSLPSPAVKY